MVKDRNSNNKSDDGLEKSKEINGDIRLNNVNSVEEKTVIKEEENPDRKRIVASKLLYNFFLKTNT